MKRWDALVAVCEYLRAGLLGEERRPHRPDLSWELLVEASTYHLVAPALAWCLKHTPDVPAEVSVFFDAILDRNAQRNEVMLAALTRIVAACNGIGIEPVPLKGAAHLIEQTYPLPSLRFLGDLDMLIPAERAADAFAALQAIGFQPSADDPPLPPSHHHLPMLHDRQAGGGVELHTEVLKGESGEAVPTAWFDAGTRPAAFAGLRIRLPDVTRSVAHIIAHDQIFHGHRWARKFELRQLLDVTMIRVRHEATIDWSELDRRFSQIGAGKVLAKYLALAETSFGQAAPRLSYTAPPATIAGFRYMAERPRLQSLVSIMGHRMEALRRNPARVLELFDWRKWPGRIRLVAAAVNKNPRR